MIRRRRELLGKHANSICQKYRGSLKKVLPLYVKEKLREYGEIRRDKIFITHSGITQDYIELVRKTIQEEMEFQNIYVTQASCTISCHCGPNTLGILFETKE